MPARRSHVRHEGASATGLAKGNYGMRLYLAPTGVDPSHLAINEFTQLAHESKFHRHELVEDPANADICLFVESHLFGDPIGVPQIWRSETFRSYREKCFIFDQRPRSYCSLPGLFTSVPRQFIRPVFQTPWSYHKIETPSEVLGVSVDAIPNADLLFSFVGSGRSHTSRPPLLELKHPRAVVERVEGHLNWAENEAGFAARRQRFAEILCRSSFVLCPRGRATSSFRFYEAMAAGRVPVVIADAWVPPKGTNLDEFAVVWPEGTTSGLVEHLERLEPEAAAMGARAREVYETRFARDVMFDNVVDALSDLDDTRPWERFPRWGYPPDRRVIRHLAGRARRIAGKVRRK